MSKEELNTTIEKIFQNIDPERRLKIFTGRAGRQSIINALEIEALLEVVRYSNEFTDEQKINLRTMIKSSDKSNRELVKNLLIAKD